MAEPPLEKTGLPAPGGDSFPVLGPLLDGLQIPKLAPLLVLVALVGIPVGVLAYQQLHLQGAGALAPADGVRTIHIEAYQWGFEPSTVTVKRGERVRILATSRDVTHGLQISNYGIDMEVKPGRWASAEFTADKPGTFTMRCSVFCSATPAAASRHSDMMSGAAGMDPGAVNSGMAGMDPSAMMAHHFQMTGNLVVEEA